MVEHGGAGQRRGGAFGALQRGLGGVGPQRQHHPHIRRTDLGAEFLIQRAHRLRHGAECRQVAFHARPAGRDHRRHRRAEQHQHQPAPGRQAQQRMRQALRQRAHGQPLRRQQRRQQEARGERRRHQPAGGEQPQLRQPRKARGQHRRQPRHRRRASQAQRRPDPPRRVAQGLPRRAVGHQQDRVVIHHPQHGHAEAECGAMHMPEHRPHHREARQRAGGQRHRHHRQHHRAAVAPEQEAADQQEGQGRDQLHVGAHRRRRLRREDAGARQQQPRAGRRRGLREGGADRRDGRLLRLRVEPRRACLRQQQRAGAIGHPDTVLGGDAPLAGPAAQHRQEGTGRVGEGEAADQRRGGGLQPVQHAFQRRAQGRFAEGRRRRGGRQRVAMGEQQRRLRLVHQRAAIRHQGEAAIGGQQLRHVARDPREVLRGGALDPRDQQPGGGAGAQFAQQEGGFLGGRGGQEVGDVAAQFDMPQQQREGGRQQRERHGQAQEAHHGAGLAISRVRPSLPWVSTTARKPPMPSSVMRCTAPRSRSERGTSTMRQRAGSPLNVTS
ncbi:hypothetical protein ROS9278_04173 [Roseomonas sp. CECT 9278]|nr:hypothetical protein ROS9278_04173 [Roseomonas sp. CECT 9278]